MYLRNALKAPRFTVGDKTFESLVFLAIQIQLHYGFLNFALYNYNHCAWNYQTERKTFITNKYKKEQWPIKQSLLEYFVGSWYSSHITSLIWIFNSTNTDGYQLDSCYFMIRNPVLLQNFAASHYNFCTMPSIIIYSLI